MFRLNCGFFFFLNYKSYALIARNRTAIMQSPEAGHNTCLAAALLIAFAKLFRVLGGQLWKLNMKNYKGLLCHIHGDLLFVKMVYCLSQRTFQYLH